MTRAALTAIASVGVAALGADVATFVAAGSRTP